MEFKEKPRIKWKEVLLAIYRGTTIGRGFGRGKKGITSDHPLAKGLKISGTELMHSLAFLEEQKLIEYGPEKNWINLTKKAFTVALQIEREKRATLNQSLLVGVTLLIAVTGTFHFFSETGLYNPYHLLGAYVLIVGLVWVGLWLIHKRLGP